MTIDIPLDTLAREINARLTKADEIEGKANDHRIAAGLQLIAARKRVDAGEAVDDTGAGIGWEHWCAININRSQRDVRRVMRIAGRKDPTAALEAERDTAREGMARSRQNRTNVSPVEPLSDAPAADISIIPKPAVGMPQLDDTLDDIKRWVIDELTDDQRDELLIWLDDYIKARRDASGEAVATEPPAPPRGSARTRTGNCSAAQRDRIVGRQDATMPVQRAEGHLPLQLRVDRVLPGHPDKSDGGGGLIAASPLLCADYDSGRQARESRAYARQDQTSTAPREIQS